jgi:hypothetical protein
MAKILPGPCMACPYRKDVASGVWAEEEYDKLPPYDAPTCEQPFALFMCHATPEAVCHGWAVCHSNRGHDKELIALRLVRVEGEIPEKSKVPLFKSGTAAARHGKKDIEQPKPRAKATQTKLLKKHKRLRLKPRKGSTKV